MERVVSVQRDVRHGRAATGACMHGQAVGLHERVGVQRVHAVEDSQLCGQSLLPR